MRRIMFGVFGLFLATALVTRIAEAAGIGPRHCGCESNCWCKHPGLSMFRWVTPKRSHHLPSHPLSGVDKRTLAENR
jgi:hypothetical protein